MYLPRRKGELDVVMILQRRPICLRLFEHCIRRAASRTACTAGNSNATSTPIMAITTSNSTSVNPLAFRHGNAPFSPAASVTLGSTIATLFQQCELESH